MGRSLKIKWIVVFALPLFGFAIHKSIEAHIYSEMWDDPIKANGKTLHRAEIVGKKLQNVNIPRCPKGSYVCFEQVWIKSTTDVEIVHEGYPANGFNIYTKLINWPNYRVKAHYKLKGDTLLPQLKSAMDTLFMDFLADSLIGIAGNHTNYRYLKQ